MTTLPRQRLGFLLACLPLALSLAPLVHADDNGDLIKDAHHQLALALNLGGDPPSAADRTTELNAASSDLKDMNFTLGRFIHARNMAMAHLKTALDLISRGDTGPGVEDEIRQADSIVRDLEG